MTAAGTAAGGAALVAGGWWVLRELWARRDERRVAARYPRSADGVIIGAEPLLLSGARGGAVLLLHGYNDSPQSLQSVARELHARGWTVRVPLLPGHGRSLREFARSGADDWCDAARREYEQLRTAHAAVAVGGLSMGGAMAFVLAADHPEVGAVVAFAPYLHASRARRAYRFVLPLLLLGPRYLWGGGERSVHDPVASEEMIAYRRSTPRTLWQLERVVLRALASLERVRAPVLVLQSREDNRIPMSSTLEAFSRLPAVDKSLRWVTGSGHVITVDYGHEAVARAAADWLEARLP